MTNMNGASMPSAGKMANSYSYWKSGEAKASDKKTTPSSDVKGSDNIVAATYKNDLSLGKTVGNPKLSDGAKKYYDELKKKYGNYDFILVSKDQMEAVKANPAKYGNSLKSVVLIDEDKIEKMATDSAYRKKYENILSGAATQLEQMKAQIEKTGGKLRNFGMTIDDNGTATFFAALEKSSAMQRERIERNAAAKRVEKKAAEKKAHDKKSKEALEKKTKDDVGKDASTDEKAPGKADQREDAWSWDDVTMFSAGSIDELINKISDWQFENRSSQVRTDSEMQVGQHIDFKG